MQIYPLAQTVVLHGNSKHPIIIIDKNNVAWGVSLPVKRKSFVEMEDLEDNIHDEILQAMASANYQPVGNWIIRVPYAIRYFTPSSVGHGEEVRRALAVNMLTHATIPGDNRGNLLITCPVLLTVVNHTHITKESISKVMQLAIGNEIDFISDSISITSHILFDCTHQTNTYSGNPYRVIEEVFGEEAFFTQTSLPQRLAQIRYLLDSKNKTAMSLSDIVDTQQPHVGSSGYLDMELGLNTATTNVFRPRVRRAMIWTEDGFMDRDEWRYNLSSEHKEIASKGGTYYMISLDAHIFDSQVNEYFEGRLTVHPNYPGLMVSIYKNSFDKEQRPTYKTALELFTEMPLTDVLGLPAFTGTTVEEAEAHLITYIETKHPAIMDALRFNGLLETIKSIV